MYRTFKYDHDNYITYTRYFFIFYSIILILLIIKPESTNLVQKLHSKCIEVKQYTNIENITSHASDNLNTVHC